MYDTEEKVFMQYITEKLIEDIKHEIKFKNDDESDFEFCYFYISDYLETRYSEELADKICKVIKYGTDEYILRL